MYQIAANVGHAVYHRCRGEERAARTILSGMQTLVDRQGSSWQMAGLLPRMSAVGYIYTGDLLGLGRTQEIIKKQIEEGYRFGRFYDLVRAVYLRELGENDAAKKILERILGEPNVQGTRALALLALAELHAADRDAPAAERVARAAIAESKAQASAERCVGARATIPLALARAHLGLLDEAAHLLEERLDDCVASPTVSGYLHDARARIAAITGDGAAFSSHMSRAQEWFEASQNPVLLARAERLWRLAAGPPKGSSERSAGALETFFETQMVEDAQSS
jgi:hypothetical protein